MTYTLITTVLLALLFLPAQGDSGGERREGAETRQDRREVRQDRRATRDDARDLATLRDIQVELARARVESDARAVAALDARVMTMLRDEPTEDARESSRGRADAADEPGQNEARARVASQWAQLEGRYERRDLERRVLLLDELVDVARAESEQDEGEGRPGG